MKPSTQAKAQQLADTARQAAFTTQKTVKAATMRAGDAAYKNRSKIDAALNKAGDALDSKTSHKYSVQITKLKTLLRKGVDRLAAQASVTATPTQTTTPADTPDSAYPGAGGTSAHDDPTN